jgi:5'-nucleotidase
MIQLPILHWNDVYRARPQKVSPTSSETIDVTQFAGLLDDIRIQWPLRDDGKRDGLSLFSGDVFAPSVDSSVTRGSHMVRSCSLGHKRESVLISTGTSHE